MSNRYVMEALLRPAVELYSAAAGGAATFVLVVAPWSMALAPQVSYVTAAGFAVFTTIRTRQGLRILRYRRNIRRLSRYQMSSESIPVSRHFLFLGRGFMWEQKHTQRLLETKRPEVSPFLKPSIFYSLARQLERRYEYTFPGMCSLTRRDSIFNPVRPLPPVGGNSAIHGVEMEEDNVLMSLTERVGHLLVLGTTRVGKTRLAELLITQDIRRGNVTIVFDPKGDADLLKRMWAEAKRAGRSDEFYIFHLGWPDISARYNAVGRFGRVSEVASRVAGQLGGEGNNAAFKEFAWRFVNIIARALVVLGLRPDYSLILRYVTNIVELYETYAEKLLIQRAPELWMMVQNQMGILTEDDLPRTMQGQVNAIRVMAIEVALSSEEGKKIYDPVLDGLRSAVRYDRTYFDKIVASLLPLLEKLTTGKTAALLSPDYSDMDDPRPLMDWQEIIRKGGIVYVGLDALSDSEVASAVGNSMFADLVSTAGYIYKFGLSDDMPDGSSQRLPISLHCDEFNELMGEEFIPMINKGGGAGIEVTAYTQTWSDIEAKIGNAAKAAQVTGNFNNLIMLRVREKTTADLLTTQLPEVEIYTKTLVSGVTDISNPEQGSDFTSNVQDRVSSTRVPLLSSAEVMNLPKGQAFALLEGGCLWKIRMPLPASVDDELMPKNLQSIVTTMRKNYRTGDTWWSGSVLPGDNLVDTL